MESDDYVNLLCKPGGDLLADRLMDELGGLSPLVCREAALYAAGCTDARVEGLDIAAAAGKLALFFREHLNHPKPYYYALPDGTPKKFAFCPIRQYGECREAALRALLDLYYTIRDRRMPYAEGTGGAAKPSRPGQRLQRKLAIQEKECLPPMTGSGFGSGDIVTANLHGLSRADGVAAEGLL